MRSVCRGITVSVPCLVCIGSRTIRPAVRRRLFLHLFQRHCKGGLHAAAVAENPVQSLFQPVLQPPAQAGVMHADIDGPVFAVGDRRIPEKGPHYRRKGRDLKTDRVTVGFHQRPGRILGGKIVVLLHIDLHSSLAEELLFHGFLHAKYPILVDQVVRTQADLQPGPLAVGGQSLHLCVLKIILQVFADFQLGKNIKKGFGHVCKLPSVTRKAI